VSALILRLANDQGIDIPRSPKTSLIFDREQNIHELRLTSNPMLTEHSQ
jgi:hypothetical protein